MKGNFLSSSTEKSRKGTVSVRPDSGSIKACFPRTYFNDGKQVKLATGINPDDWEGKASLLQRRLQLELEEGKLSDNGVFNIGRYQQILEEYGCKVNVSYVRKTKSELIDVLTLWDNYCEYRRPHLKQTTYIKRYCGQFRQYIFSSISFNDITTITSTQQAIQMRDWLISNRHPKTVKDVLSNLKKAYDFAIKSNLITIPNPFIDITIEGQFGSQGKTIDEVKKDLDNDFDILDQSKAYSWSEAQTIIEYTKEYRPHWHDIIKFKFLTGCRTGEAISLMWGDVKFDKQELLIRRTYDDVTKKFYPTKTSHGDNQLIRRFPMPEDSELYALLQSLTRGENNQIVFLSKQRKIIDSGALLASWKGRKASDNYRGFKGIIPNLIEQEKLTKYLKPYNTRHTFITHQIFDLGRDPRIVSAWVGHTELVSQKHYQDVSNFSLQFHPDR